MFFQLKPSHPFLSYSNRQNGNQVSLPLLDTVTEIVLFINIIENEKCCTNAQSGCLLMENKLVYFQHHYHAVQFTALTPCR